MFSGEGSGDKTFCLIFVETLWGIHKLYYKVKEEGGKVCTEKCIFLFCIPTYQSGKKNPAGMKVLSTFFLKTLKNII